MHPQTIKIDYRFIKLTDLVGNYKNSANYFRLDCCILKIEHLEQPISLKTNKKMKIT